MCSITTVRKPLNNKRSSFANHYIPFNESFYFLQIIEKQNVGIKSAVITFTLLLRFGVRKLHRHSFTNACCSIKRGGGRDANIGQEYVTLKRTLISPK